MKNKNKPISLSNWPTDSSHHPQSRLSPLTEKILITAKIDPQDILPITIQQFAQTYQLSPDTKHTLLKQFHEQKELRTKRVQLLKSLWEKMYKKKMKTSQRNSLVLGKKYSIRKDSLKIGQYSPLVHPKKSKSKSPSPLIFKARSKKKILNTQYFNEYEYQRKQNSNTDESTKSKPTISIKQSSHKTISPNDDYFETKVRVKNRKHKAEKVGRRDDREKLIQELSQLMLRWSQLYEKHAKQEYEIVGLGQKERKRLEKMQEIEKKQLKQKIEAVSQKVNEQTPKSKK